MHDTYGGRSERAIGRETDRRALALAGWVGVLAGARAGTLACAGGGGGRPASLVTADSCALGTVTEQKLALEDGRAVYVEPSTIEGTARRFLLAGTPAIVWPVGAAESAARFGLSSIYSPDSCAGSPSAAATFVRMPSIVA